MALGQEQHTLWGNMLTCHRARSVAVVHAAPGVRCIYHQVLKLSLLDKEWSKGGSVSRPVHVLHTVLMGCLSQAHGAQGLLGVSGAVLAHDNLRNGTGWQQSKQK